MMNAGNLPLYLLFITSVILVAMLGYVASFREKNTIHYLFISGIAALLIWHISVIIAGFFQSDPVKYVFIDNFTYIGIAAIPICLLFVGMSYNKDFKGFHMRHLLFLIIPITTIVMVFTNDYHHLFYLSYTMEGGYVVGPYFYVHTFYSYVCMLVGMLMLSYYAIKTSGILSVQAILTVVGSLIPAVVNVCYTLNVPGFTIYSTPVAFTITVLSYLISIFRYGLLKVVPIAMQTVINQISDCFVVVDEHLYILDYNRAFKERFINCAPTKQSDRLDQLLDALALPFDQQESICTNVLETVRLKQTHKEELCIVFEEEFYYSVEYTLVSGKRQQSAVVVLFKDITQHVLDLQAIKNNQNILLERERLASLGQMIGGIAHNLKTPILSVSGGIDQVQCLVKEYSDSIGDEDVTTEDHLEIAREMEDWLGKMKSQMSYMSDIISTVKDQAAQFNTGSSFYFTVDEMLKRVKILMQHSLIKGNCHLEVDVKTGIGQMIFGDINSLVQIMDNIIANAIQAYEGKSGKIHLSVERIEEDILFSISDFAGGIKPEVQKVLFNEMITTKGKHGTGLGLYMSHSTIKGVFRGNMWLSRRHRLEPHLY